MKQKALSKPVVRRGSRGCSAAKRGSDSTKGCGSSNNYLQAIINSLDDELMVVDKDYQIIQVNEAALRKHGKRREEVIGKHCHHLSHDGQQPCCPPDQECAVNKVCETLGNKRLPIHEESAIPISMV